MRASRSCVLQSRVIAHTRALAHTNALTPTHTPPEAPQPLPVYGIFQEGKYHNFLSSDYIAPQGRNCK